MTTVSNSDVRANIAISIPDLGYKCMDPLIASVYIELREDYRVRCMLNH